MSCPHDTDGDGDCGRIGCPYCGGGPAVMRRRRDSQIERAKYVISKIPPYPVTTYRGVPVDQLEKHELVTLIGYLIQMNENLKGAR